MSDKLFMPQPPFDGPSGPLPFGGSAGGNLVAMMGMNVPKFCQNLRI